MPKRTADEPHAESAMAAHAEDAYAALEALAKHAEQLDLDDVELRANALAVLVGQFVDDLEDLAEEEQS